MTPYRRALADPAFLRRVAERYAGPHDVLDALSWLDDPEAPGPTGTPSPYAGLQGRRAALYRPGADPAEGEAVARLIAEQDAERARLATATAEPEREQAASARVPAAKRPGRRPAVLLLAVPAAALAFVAGLAVGPALGSRAQPLPSIEPAQVPQPVVVRPSGGDALAVFEGPQRSADRPLVKPDGDLVAGSFRRLVALPGQDATLYAARTTERQVCLVAVTVDAHLTASCADPADFRGTPCSVDLSVTKDPSTDDPKDTRTEIAATWSYDGTLRAGAVS